jgi:hypothetical protein
MTIAIWAWQVEQQRHQSGDFMLSHSPASLQNVKDFDAPDGVQS